MTHSFPPRRSSDRWNDDRGGEAGFQVRRPFRRLETLNGMAGLLPLDEAQARLLALAEALPIETIAVAEAGGRWAASDIIARRSQPAADLSRSEAHTSELQSLMRNSYAVFCLKK